MKIHKHEPLSSAKAGIALLILFIVFIVFYKFLTNQEYLFSDPEMLRNYVAFAIVGAGFLVGLLYLVSQTQHPKPTKATKKKKSK